MTLPNKLTLLRICFIPIIIIISYIPFLKETVIFWNISWANFINFILFAIAAFTDQLDGMIARKNNLVTTFGKFADPLADKLLVMTALIILSMQVYNGMAVIEAWVCIVILSREFIVTGIRLVAVEGGTVIAASIFGKLKTVFTMVALAGLFLHQINNVIFYIGMVLIYISTALTVLSGIEYFWKNRKIILKSI